MKKLIVPAVALVCSYIILNIMSNVAATRVAEAIQSGRMQSQPLPDAFLPEQGWHAIWLTDLFDFLIVGLFVTSLLLSYHRALHQFTEYRLPQFQSQQDLLWVVVPGQNTFREHIKKECPGVGRHWACGLALCNMLRALIVASTTIPDSRPECMQPEKESRSLFAVQLHRCGDAMFSGYMALATITVCSLYEAWRRRLVSLRLVVAGFLLLLMQALSILMNRTHYSMDVLVAVFVSVGVYSLLRLVRCW